MIPRPLGRVVLGLALVGAWAAPVRAQGPFTIKEGITPAPKELSGAVGALLDTKTVQLLDAKGNALCEVWFRKEVPAKATPVQVKNGLTYREMEETTLLGAIKIEKALNDYRKQKIKEGVYTLRLGFQPSDGDHMGTAPNNEFCLLVPAADDKDPAPLMPKLLQEKSAKASGGTHPAVLLLFPADTKPGAAAKLAKDSSNHWTVTRPVEVKAGDAKAMLGIVLTLVGVSSAA